MPFTVVRFRTDKSYTIKDDREHEKLASLLVRNGYVTTLYVSSPNHEGIPVTLMKDAITSFHPNLEWKEEDQPSLSS